ncbi:hypothetical protein SCUCBS95973_001415 [Sporothrix curviconia]|uniref:Uncharacterized protein n=1 Tax=Sporothrix curviconia TaxID=1260050 RepID=A0ABP0AYE3_9PEZI
MAGEWPPIIGDIPVPYKGNAKIFFDGRNLLRHGHGHDADVASFLPLLEPVLTKAGRPRVHQPWPPPKKPTDWWRAQCFFRSLPISGSIPKMQERLRGHATDPMASVFQDLCATARAMYRAKNDAACEHKWLNEWTDEHKIKRNPTRFFDELKQRQGRPAKDAVAVIKGEVHNEQVDEGYSQNIKRLAEAAHVFVEIVHGPVPGTWPRYWTVLGRTKAAVASRAKKITAETKAFRKREAEAAAAAEAAEAAAAAAASTALANRRTAALDACDDWDVLGTYRIFCPAVSKEWPSMARRMYLKVYRSLSPFGLLAARFDFGIVQGVFSIRRPMKSTKSRQGGWAVHGSTNNKRKREDDDGGHRLSKRHEYEDDGEGDNDDAYADAYDGDYYSSEYNDSTDDDDDDDDYEDSNTPHGPHRKWAYRWRGEETSQSEIQLGSDEDEYHISFYGPRVHKIKGTFGGGPVGACTFMGFKTGVGADLTDRFNLKYEWERYSQEAYDRASVARWGKGSW